MPLRDYQLRCGDEARAAYRAGKRAILIVLPTGAGKTRTMVAMLESAHAKGSRCLWLAHRQELVKQAAGAIEACGIRPGIIAPWAPATRAAIQVGSIDTLKARGLRPDADIVVLDEAHHATADKNLDVLGHYKTRGALLFGLTATPQREDGVALGNVFDHLIAPVSHAQLIASGHLVPAKVVGPTAKTKALAEDPVAAYLALALGRQCIAFSSSIDAGKRMVQAFEAFRIRATWVDGETSDDERAAAIAAYCAGRIQVLVNYLVLTEGFDAPATSCVLLARGMASCVSYLQATGRGLRPAPGKRDCLVIDLYGCSHEHGLPDEPREYSLEGRAIKSAADAATEIRQCPECGHWFRAEQFQDATCPGCGAFLRGRQDPAVRRQILAAINSSHPDTRRTEKLRELLQIATKRGYKRGWAMMQFKVRYGHWPSEHIMRNAGFYQFQATARKVAS